MLRVRFFVPAKLCGALDVVVGMLSYVVGTIFRTRMAVVVLDVVVGLYRMLWVRFFVPARLCRVLDVVVGDAIVCCGYEFSYPQGGGSV
jgi:hypothetical protein